MPWDLICGFKQCTDPTVCELQVQCMTQRHTASGAIEPVSNMVASARPSQACSWALPCRKNTSAARMQAILKADWHVKHLLAASDPVAKASRVCPVFGLSTFIRVAGCSGLDLGPDSCRLVSTIRNLSLTLYLLWELARIRPPTCRDQAQRSCFRSSCGDRAQRGR